MAKKKKRGRGKKGQRNLLVAAAVGGVLYLLLKGKGADAEASASVTISDQLQPAAVKAGETLSVGSYRVISDRRGGMSYDPITGGQEGMAITFVASRDGMFTRNLVREGGQLWAEIK